MGLIMLILVGTVPMAYALNRAMPANETVKFAAVAEMAQNALNRSVPTSLPALEPAAARDTLSTYVRTREFSPSVVPALAVTAGSIGQQVREHGSLAGVPADAVANVRNDMYLASEAIRHLDKSGAAKFDDETKLRVNTFRQELDSATRFIPLWVKVAVAIALGLGTMIGWKRIVVTVGEKIGKTHLSYAQGASAEVVAMITIGAADMYGLPVSTTHVLSSGVAGTMTASGSGLQMSTLRNLALAWVLTLPVAMLLSGSLYWLFTRIF
jgi:PiT family inorganic phosphate transporter